MTDQGAVRACVEAAYTPYIKEIGVTPAPLNDDYAKLIDEGRVWVAVTSRGDTVGVLVMFMESDHILLDNCAVIPEWQNRGIGKLFGAMVKREGRRHGILKSRLYTNAKMTKNQAIYRKLGWIEVERRTEKGFDRVYMERVLGDDEGWE